MAAPIAALLLLASCSTTAPAEQDLSFDRYEAALLPPGVQLRDTFIEVVAEAQVSLDLAVERFDDTASAEAVLAAARRGVAVRVVTDADSLGDAGFGLLRSAGIPVVSGDGPLRWSPSPGLEMLRLGSHNRMTHNFAVVDAKKVFTASAGPQVAGGTRRQLQAVFESADLAKDFGDVFEQMFGGIFATTVTAYGEPMPADTNNRTRIPMPDGSVLSTWFGPQEPILKEVIDRVYSARASVFVATTQLSNRELVAALRYKASAGFEVRVVVDASEATADGSRAAELEASFAALGPEAKVSLQRVDDLGFNALVTDTEASPVDGSVYDASLVMTTQPAVETNPFVVGAAGPIPRAADGFFDSHAWAVSEQASRPHPLVREVAAWIRANASR
jgi:hypothetical protein